MDSWPHPVTSLKVRLYGIGLFCRFEYLTNPDGTIENVQVLDHMWSIVEINGIACKPTCSTQIAEVA